MDMQPNAGYTHNGTVPTTTYRTRQPRIGAKLPIHLRQPGNPPRQDVSFTGRGWIPDYMSEDRLVMMPELSRTMLENGTVMGSEGMMPAPGNLPRPQLGQSMDNGAGGAGSFATISAFRGRG